MQDNRNKVNTLHHNTPDCGLLFDMNVCLLMPHTKHTVTIEEGYFQIKDPHLPNRNHKGCRCGIKFVYYGKNAIKNKKNTVILQNYLLEI